MQVSIVSNGIQSEYKCSLTTSGFYLTLKQQYKPKIQIYSKVKASPLSSMQFKENN